MTGHIKPTRVLDADNNESREIDFSAIPLIDLAPLYGDDAKARQQMAAELREACINIGFFYVKNHGVPEYHLQDVRTQTEQFFALPEHIKTEWGGPGE